MWWLITYACGKIERIFTFDTEWLCKLIWIGKIINCEYDDKYKEEFTNGNSNL